MIILSYFILIPLMHFEFEHNDSLRACEYALDMLVCAVGSVFRSLIKSEMQMLSFLGV